MFKQQINEKIIFALAFLLFSSAASASSLTETGRAGPLRWKNHLIQIAFSNSLAKPTLNIKPDSDVKGALLRSLETWENAADLKFETSWTEKQTVSPKGNFGDGVNLITIAQTPENLLLFSRDSGEVSARTRVFFSKTGNITEADIVLNPYQQFSTDGSFGTFDLETTLTHEIGHLLGLEHSPVMAATMSAGKGKNGIFNLASLDGRTLGQTDIAAVRALYGTKTEIEKCCGTITGNIELKNNKSNKTLIVWAEDAESGRLAGQTMTKTDGSFSLDGMPIGKYRLFCQKNPNAGNSLAAAEIGIAEVKKSKSAIVSKTAIELVNNSQNLQVLGVNGELSQVAVPLNAGKSYTVYLGGKNLNPDSVKIGFDSPSIKVLPESLTAQDFGSDLQVVSFTVNIEKNILPGEYNVYIIQSNGEKEYFLGGLTIEDYINPWNNYDLSGN